MNHIGVKTLSVLLLLLAPFLAAREVRAENYCLGQTSVGNPYYCYGNGNCTWWAWKMARDNWGDPLLAPAKWGDAKNWAAGARKAGYTVMSEPAPNTIAVNTTVYSASAGRITGHVAYVKSVDNVGGYVYVSEMNYGSGTLNTNKRYSKAWFQWYIHPKPRPAIYSISPNPRFWAWGDLDYWVSGANLDYNERVRICWPSGGCTILSGAQVPYSNPYQFMMRATISASGMWNVTAINNDGRESLPYYFYIW